MPAPMEAVAAWPVTGFGVGADPADPGKIALIAQAVRGVVALEFDEEQTAQLVSDLVGAMKGTAGKQ
jgi:hypothetical protein